MDEAIRELAREAGIANDWVDAAGAPRRVAIDPLRHILAALGLPAASAADVAESRARLRKSTGGARTFVTATICKPVAFPGLSIDRDAPAELSLETGETKAITVRAVRDDAANRAEPQAPTAAHSVRYRRASGSAAARPRV